MSKTLKISAIAASLLVSGILVGCGSSNDGSSSNPAPQTTKVFTVTDDYVLNANVYSVVDSAKSRSLTSTRANNSSANGTGNDTKPEPTPVEKPDATAQSTGKGAYKFSALKAGSIVKSVGGVVDVNNNGKVDSGEPTALNMASKASNSFVNPFTTFEVYTNANIAELFGIPKADIDTTTDDVKVRQAVALANAMIAEAQFNPSKYGSTPVIPSKPDSNSTSSDSVLPFSAQDALQKVLDQVSAQVKGGATLASAVAKVTGTSEYSKVSEANLTAVNALIVAELKKHTGSVNPGSKPADKPSDTSGSVLPF